MFTTIDVLIAVAGIIAVLLAWLFTKQSAHNRLCAVNEKLAQQEVQLAQLISTSHELRQQKELLLQQSAKTEGLLQSATEQCNGLKRYQRDNEILNSQLTLYKTKFHAAEEKLELQKAELEMIGSQFKHEFKNPCTNYFRRENRKVYGS